MKLRSPRRSLLLPALSLALALAACGDSGSSAADAAPAAPDAGSPDAHVPADCSSPFALPVDPQAKTRAQAALAALAPAATFEWSEARQTLSSAAGLGVELPGCSGDTDAYAKLFDFLEATPDLFQIDRNDWRVGPALSCADVTAGNLDTIVIRRIKYGPLALVNDVFHADLDLVDGKVVVKNLGGTYIPRADTATLDRLQSCPEKPLAELEPALRARPFAYANFDPPPAPLCSLGAPGSYTAVPADTLTIGPDFELMWEEGETSVSIYKMKQAVLRVAAAGITPELERSDANCPDDAFNPRVGWIRYFDPVSGEILGDKANPIEGCVVC